MQSPISQGTLNLFQGLAQSVMLDTVIIEHQGARVSRPGGGWAFEEGTETTTVGKIGPLSDSAIERLQQDQIQYAGMEELRIPKDVVVSSSDTLTVQSARHGTTQAYTIEAVVPKSTFGVQQSLIVKAVS